MGTIHRLRTMTAAFHLLMVFLLKITMARVESENAARLQSRVTVDVPDTHKYTLHRYCGLGSVEPTIAWTAEVEIMIATSALISPAMRRLMR